MVSIALKLTLALRSAVACCKIEACLEQTESWWRFGVKSMNVFLAPHGLELQLTTNGGNGRVVIGCFYGSGGWNCALGVKLRKHNVCHVVLSRPNLAVAWETYIMNGKEWHLWYRSANTPAAPQHTNQQHRPYKLFHISK